MGLLFVCLAAHDSESRRWPSGDDPLICQTFAASPAEPGELLFWFSVETVMRPCCTSATGKQENPPGMWLRQKKNRLLQKSHRLRSERGGPDAAAAGAFEPPEQRQQVHAARHNYG